MEKRDLPLWINTLLDSLLGPDQAEIIKGDLQECYADHTHRYGLRVANLRLLGNFMSVLRPRVLLRRQHQKLRNQWALTGQDLRITWRLFRKERINSLLNLLGLAIGFCSAILAWVYISNQLSYDQFVPDAERTYRIESVWPEVGPYAKTAFPIGPQLVRQYPFIEGCFRYLQVFANDGSGVPISIGEAQFIEDKIVSADPAFIAIYNLKFLKGDAQTALSSPTNIVLTKKAAYKYFGQEDPIGRSITLEGKYEMMVSGVVESIGYQSHLDFEMLTPMSFMQEVKWKGWDGFEHEWASSMVWTYVLLKEAGDREKLTEVLNDLGNVVPTGAIKDGRNYELRSQSIRDIHLHSDIGSEFKPNGKMLHLVTFGLVAFLILTISMINFVNLTTARSLIRIKEIGVKKVIGAARAYLIRQFYLETFMYCMISALTALFAFLYFKQDFNFLMTSSLWIDQQNVWQWIGFVFVLVLLTTLFGGFYPSLYLSGFAPIGVLKGRKATGSSGIRQALVMVQIVASMILIVCTLIIHEQMSFIQGKDLGMNSSQLMVISRPPRSVSNQTVLQAFNQYPEVQSITAGGGSLPGYPKATWYYHPDGFPKERQVFNTAWAYDHIAEVLDLNLLAGKDFNHVLHNDSIKAIMLNRAAVESLGWTPEEAIGKSFGEYIWRSEDTNPGRVVAVVEDFHYESLHTAVEPLVLLYTSNDFGNLVVSISSSNLLETLREMERTWAGLVPDIPFHFRFMDDKIAQLYEREFRIKQSMNFFTLLALLTTAMGLFGLLSFLLMQKTKELSIHKILGASLVQVLAILSQHVVKLLGLGLLIASALGYGLMTYWLNDFSYRIDIGVLPFIISAGLICLLIGLLLLSQSFHIHRINPVKTLRNE